MRAAACRWCCTRRSAERINRAWGLALRKRFCRGFGFELQAAANEEAIVISLGLKHSFPLEDVFDYLHPNSVKEILTQAVLDQPMFESRWRWNATRSLVLERFQNGKAVPPQILRMRAADLLAAGFSRGRRLSGKSAAGRSADPDGSSAGAADHRRLPERGDGHRRADRGAQGLARRVDRARGGRYSRAVGIRPGDSEFRAVHVPRRCPAGGTPHAGGAVAANARTRGCWITSARSIRPPSNACARRPGRSRSRRRSA